MWWNLMDMFGLEGEVCSLVRTRARELLADRGHDFAFNGEVENCRAREAHPPHVIGSDETVQQDNTLVKFCLGREGELPDSQGTLYIVLTEHQIGSAGYHEKASGYWFVA